MLSIFQRERERRVKIPSWRELDDCRERERDNWGNERER